MSGRTLTLGSLFDGSGGFPLGGLIVGIMPVWASEIEPLPIRVTTRRIPQMKHYGDVRTINGAGIEPVDIITFSSPCQDLSVAGKHKGLEGSRSRLFYEAVRIIKEMRKATNGEYPRYAIWENVPGALSSNGGEDFRTVLESLCSIKGAVSVSRPKRWTVSGEIVGDEFSLAWRTLDAQYWGVPQRRKRVFTVVDFAGYRAGKILFERRGVCGRAEKSFEAWTKIAPRPEKRAGISSAGWSWQNSLKTNGTSYQKEMSPTIRAYNVPSVAFGFGRESTPAARRESQPSITSSGAGMVYDGRTAVRRLTPLECCRLQGFPDWWCDGLETENLTDEDLTFWRDVFKTVGKKKSDAQLRKWLKNPRSDTAEYKMWGNGVALPCVVFVMTGITEQENRNLKPEEVV